MRDATPIPDSRLRAPRPRVFPRAMHVPFDLAESLGATLTTAAVAAGLADAPAFAPEVRTADPRHADFQANGVLGYAKARKLNPRAVAEQLVAALPAETLAQFAVAVAGPGFINFTLRPAALLAWLQAYDSAAHLKSAASQLYHGRRQVVDFSSPNTAKQLHVGHIRGMVIGEAICRLLAFCGAEVTRDNHIGDWGTQFGKLIWGFKNLRNDAALAADPLEELERLYKAADAATKSDPATLDAVRAELVKLQSGDAENLALWQRITAISTVAFEDIYRLLGIRFDVTLGESFYNDKLQQVYDELIAAGIAEESQGALAVFHPEHPRFKTQPFIIRKSDGAANYASTDLATMLYRAEHFRADAIAVLTDARQGDHFEQLWLTTQKWFAKTGRRLPQFEHVAFGSILGEDGKAIKTRSGDPIRLRALLDEAVERRDKRENQHQAYRSRWPPARGEHQRADEEQLREAQFVIDQPLDRVADVAGKRQADEHRQLPQQKQRPQHGRRPGDGHEVVPQRRRRGDAILKQER